MIKTLKLLRNFFLLWAFLTVAFYLSIMTVFKIFLDAYWSVYNPIGNPFVAVIGIIVFLVLLIPGIGFNWKYYDAT